MNETKHLLRALDDIQAPDLWERVQGGSPEDGGIDPGRPLWKRVLPVAIAAAITLTIVLMLSHAFRSGPPRTPAVSPTPAIGPVEDVKLGAPRVFRLGAQGNLTSAREAFGSLWTIQSLDGVEELQRRDRETAQIDERFSLPVYGGGEWGGDGIEVGAGRVWVRAWNSATIYAIDPTSDAVTSFPLDGKVVSDLFVDDLGRVWANVLSSRRHVEVIRLDPSSGEATAIAGFDAAWWGGLWAIDGTLWTLERQVDKASGVHGGSVTEIAPGGVSVDVGGSFALPVTDGSSLYAPSSGDARAMNLASGIARIDPSTGEVLDRWKTGAIGYDIAFGDDGGIWFLAGGSLQRLNPNIGTLDVDVHIDGTPIFVAPTADGVWVATYQGSLAFFPFRG